MSVHTFTHKGKSVRFGDIDLIEAIPGNSIDLLISAVYVVTAEKGSRVFNEDEIAEIRSMPLQEAASKFEFSMTMLVRECLPT